MSANRHVGQWADSGAAAMRDVLAEVNVDPAEYVVCEYSGGFSFKLAPLDPDRPEIHVEIVYSEPRDQYRATAMRS